jgi:MFS family permease
MNLKNPVFDKIWTKDFIMLCMSNILMAIAFYCLISILPIYLDRELKMPNGIIGIILAAFTIASLIIRPFTGYILDSFGRKSMYLISLLILSILFGVYPYVLTFFTIFFLRLAHGLAWGASTTSGVTVAVDIIPPQKRGEGLGFFGLSYTIAMALGPMLGILILDGHNFSRLFIFGGILSAIGFLFALFVKYPKFVNFNKNEFQFKKMFDKKAFPVSLNIIFMSIVYGGLLSFVSIYAKEIGINNTGSFFFIIAIGIGISRILSGKIFDKNGPWIISIFAFVALATGFAILAFFRSHAGFHLSALIIGLGSGILMPTFQAMANNVVVSNKRGAANSTFYMAFDLGIGIGMVLIGFLADLITIGWAFLVCSMISILGLILYILYVNEHYHNNKVPYVENPLE